ncbi:hypothetical protein GH714_021141 [Hevea brasiliensis]|uniref:Remorin C-terminal domain-containing protein n=1 Tax=Hevea brasiliensis TaxID=3981 RepID=A0A6A6MFT5_HEVBR|nr:hypothetical protein GH714_021141 [Hevea brasiliensis]
MIVSLQLLWLLLHLLFTLWKKQERNTGERSEGTLEVKTEIRTRKEDSSAGSVRVTRPSSSKEVKHAEQDHRVQGTFMPARKPSRLASTKPMASTDQRRKGTSTRSEVVESKIDSWEKAQLRKINKRYEKKKSKVFAWENEKKMEAKLHMERKRFTLDFLCDQLRERKMFKRIDAIVGGARAQLEEKRRNEEAEVKEKAKYMRRKGKNPVRNIQIVDCGEI